MANPPKTYKRFTTAQWDLLLEAVAYYETVLEEEFVEPIVGNKIAALERALEVARQLQ